MTESTRLLVRALRREPTPRAPVWLMRQAGRYLPEYRELRAKSKGFLDLATNPEYAAEVTLQPIRRFGMDAAILFSDILIPLEAMGMKLLFDERGPVLPEPLRKRADVDALQPVVPRETMGFVGETLQRVREGLPEETAMIGFCGSPFTLASYAIEGGTSRTFSFLRTMMYRQEDVFRDLMDKLAVVVADHLRYQIESGAEAVVLFDTWAAVLTPEDYRRYAKPWTQRIVDALARADEGGGAPRVVFGGAADHLLEDLAELGAEAVAIDHRTSISDAFERTGGRVALQGNFDPMALFASPDEVARRTRALLDEVDGRPGHVLNLGHGVLKQTEPECVGAFVKAAQEYTR